MSTNTEAVMATYIQHYMDKNIEGLLDLFCATGDIHVWGTGIDEDINSLIDYTHCLMRDFNEADTLIKLGKTLHTFCHQSTASISCYWYVEYRPAQSTKEWCALPPLRSTLYLEQEGEVWKIRHAHWSFPFTEQPGRAIISFSSRISTLNIVTTPTQ